ncbi:glyoxalase III HchA [Vibrio hangzhouensis]|uniref:Molecular chaperone Hsp31 and glyoxalase 3 n=1 Tax=Vibrio hangzhouensis TaxID=462991 RepID=A0A1H5X2H4_9VIBR|nr:glyoxalase III HchA [Vibrio hangzhouensis]SEG06034.1 molecular chaperone Hsp31 and glyoxalase 3 [Vibrio hangzhouensis]
MLKKLLGLAPHQEPDGSYSPSKLALKLATSDKTDYKAVSYPPYAGSKTKILVIATEQKNMEMQNGKQFSTGNHPVETLVPMLHLKNAGFDFEICTPTGKPAILEMWAFPKQDEHVKAIYSDYKAAFDNPKNLYQLIEDNQLNADDYAAVFLPGGHGAMLGLPEDENVGSLLHWAHDHDLFTVSICHGPAALLSTMQGGNDFLYQGYKMAVFPDSVDAQTPLIGYLPGKMTQGLSENLKQLGVTLVNTKADNAVCLDRRLITGASPLAADALGKLAAETLLSADR